MRKLASELPFLRANWLYSNRAATPQKFWGKKEKNDAFSSNLFTLKVLHEGVFVGNRLTNYQVIVQFQMKLFGILVLRMSLVYLSIS